MATEHKNIIEADLHNPKGYSTAVDHQALHREPDGLGGSKVAWKFPMGTVYGEMDIIGNTTAKSMTAAADATLNTDSDYVKLSGTGFPWSASHQDRITFTGSEFVAQYAGDYYISFWASIKVAAINTFIGIKYALNDTTPYSPQKIIDQAVTANDICTLSATGIIANLAVGDTISIYIASTVSTNITVTDAGVTAIMLHEAIV